MKKTVQLNTVFRQTGNDLIEALREIRVGKCSLKTQELLRQRCVSDNIPNGAISSTRLCTHKDEADRHNRERLEELEGEVRTFESDDKGRESFVNALARSCPARASIQLKVGAQVMLVKTISATQGLVNGLRGVVVGFAKTLGYPRVEFDGGLEVTVGHESWDIKQGGAPVASRTQLPLELAWAISIHKSQGMSLAQVELSLGKVFEYGQAYVALSRVRSLQGLRLTEFHPSFIRAHPRVAAFYDSLE
mmetsp:Transcript_4332/g.10269  ORF Transcript_4332/g.10269 Transcript_4332/m.10269 type:complete len:248 (-) Transcript_4332:26-769(-)